MDRRRSQKTLSLKRSNQEVAPWLAGETPRAEKPTKSRASLSAEQPRTCTSALAIRPETDAQQLAFADAFFDVVVAQYVITTVPDPEGALKLLEENGVRPEEAAIVGDSHVDIETGRNAGLWTVGVNYGFAPHTLTENPPDVLVDTPHELAEVFA